MRCGATLCSSEHPGPRLRDFVLAVKACCAACRTGTLDHHGEFYDMDFMTRQWSAGPIDAPDQKVDITAVNPWMLRVADRGACALIRRAWLSWQACSAESG
jgi:hypothetical protein